MIQLIFVHAISKKRTLVNGLYSEKFSDIIEKYREKAQDFENVEFYNSFLNPNPNLSLLDLGLQNFSVIYVSPFRHITGGMPVKFTDVSKNQIKELGFSKNPKNIPSYRTVKKGINIFGFCRCKKCSARNKEVIVPIEGDKLDLIQDKDELSCPECESTIIPKTVGFYLCKYKIFGKKVGQNNIIENFENPIGEAKNKNTFNYFSPESNGETTMIELKFEVLKYY